VEGVRNKA